MAVTFEFADKDTEERLATRDELIAYLEKHYHFEKVRATLKYSHNTFKARINIYNNDIFIYAKGRRRWGNYMNVHHVEAVTIPEKRKSKEEVWRDSWQTVIDYLEQSGLWENYKNKYKLGLEIGYENINKAERLYWKRWDDDTALEQIKEVDERLVKTNEQGVEYADTSILWAMASKAKVKTIYFGKHRTDDVRQALKEAMENKEPFSEYEAVPNYYDVSVRYDPERMSGSYSEEYRGCGNGHYYMLLDYEHALFTEDD